MNEPIANLKQVLSTQVGFETVLESASGSQVRLEGRVSKTFTDNWLVFMDHLLVQEERAPWNVDISRHYFRRGSFMVYAWRLIFQHEALEVQLPLIIDTVKNSPKARVEVQEQALPGMTGVRRMSNGTGKGAFEAGTVPAIISRGRGGGVVRR
jgi:hypothetical protein